MNVRWKLVPSCRSAEIKATVAITNNARLQLIVILQHVQQMKQTIGGAADTNGQIIAWYASYDG